MVAPDIMDIPLSEMIRTLREELQGALNDGKGKGLQFSVDKIDLELKVAVTRQRHWGGAVMFGVINTDGGRERSREMVHTFRLSLTPAAEGGGAGAGPEEPPAPGGEEEPRP